MALLKPVGVNAPQIEYWNGPTGQRWVDFAENQDAKLLPIGLAAIDYCDIQPGQAVLDTGCGNGTTAFEIARRVGDEGQVVGVDISGPMLDNARERLAESGLRNVTFELDDVATYPFEENTFDRAFSRFGVMFFIDPVMAFANIRRGLKKDGRLGFVCWQERQKSAHLEIPFQVIAKHIQVSSVGDAGAPGPMSLANPDRIRRILTEAGYKDIRVEPLEIDLPFESDAVETARTMISVGQAWRLLRDASDEIKQRVVADLIEAIRPFETENGVRLGSASWLVSARAP